MPTASVIVPMFQSEATVADTVRSLQADDAEGSTEIIVVNDGSTDRGPAIVAELAGRDQRIRLVSRENGGLAAARNTGILHARGGYFRFLDADDWALPGGTARLIAEAERTGLGAACGSFTLRDECGRDMARSIPPRADADRTVGLDQLLSSNALGVGAVAIRRDVLANDRFDERLPVCEDWEMWLRLAMRGVRFAALTEPPVKAYRIRSGSLSKNYERMFTYALDVRRQGFARARSLPAGGMTGAVDTGDARLFRAGDDTALGFGSMAAASGNLSLAMSIIDKAPAPVHLPWSAAEVGAAGVWGVLQGPGDRPDEPHGHPGWLAHLDEFWHILKDRRQTDGSDVDRAWGDFATAAVSQDLVADRIARDLVAEQAAEASLWGMGRNGRLLTARLLAHGITVRARDGRWPDGRPPEHELAALTGAGFGGSLVPEPLTAPVAPGTPIVITPESDTGLVEHLAVVGGPARVRRWIHVVDRLAVEIRADLAPALRACRTERAVRS